MPCAVESNTAGLVATHGPVDLVLYYARNATGSASLETIVATLDSSTAPWRRCIGTITLLGANLSAAEDVYNPAGGDNNAEWNRGPNMQFYRFATWLLLSEQHVNTPFFYMEGDTVPTQPGWLDALRAEVADKMPFAVLGSRYSGHNWDRYKDVVPPVLPDALLYHLNGNAVYGGPPIL